MLRSLPAAGRRFWTEANHVASALPPTCLPACSPDRPGAVPALPHARLQALLALVGSTACVTFSYFFPAALVGCTVACMPNDGVMGCEPCEPWRAERGGALHRIPSTVHCRSALCPSISLQLWRLHKHPGLRAGAASMVALGAAMAAIAVYDRLHGRGE